jgi:hypothetical protein
VCPRCEVTPTPNLAPGQFGIGVVAGLGGKIKATGSPVCPLARLRRYSALDSTADEWPAQESAAGTG